MANVRRPCAAVAAALLFNPMLGSLYAWSVFLAPLEAELSVPRAEISSVFSIAILCFTVGLVSAPPVSYTHLTLPTTPYV